MRTNDGRNKSAQSALERQIISTRAATVAIMARLALPIGEKAEDESGRKKSGYRSGVERHGKQQRLAHLAAELARLNVRSRPIVVRGGQRLWRARQNLGSAKLTETSWREQWREARSFRAALGSADELSGNLTMRVSESGELTLLLPVALRQHANTKSGRHYRLDATASFSYRGAEWQARLASGRAISYIIRHELPKDRWYLDASWKLEPLALPLLAHTRRLGLDLNADHVACWVLDSAGNPIGAPQQIAFRLAGSSGQRDAIVRWVISALLRLAKDQDCTAMAIEELGWGAETGRDNGQPRWFRHLIAGFPTTIFRDRLASMAARAGLVLVAVDPAYTSKWAKPWIEPTSTNSHLTSGHEAAAIVIGRRSLGFGARRRVVIAALQSDEQRRANRRAGTTPSQVANPGVIFPMRRRVSSALSASGP